jgi:hypothetical protein
VWLRRAASALSLGLALLAPRAIEAQPSAPLPEWIHADPFDGGELDPLAVDRSDQLEAVSPTRSDEEVHEHVPVQRGEVLEAIAGVREEGHTVDIRLAHGLAVVDTEMRFTSSARHAAEVRYRLAVPEGASLAGLEVCNAVGCRSGLVEDVAGLSSYDDVVRGRGRNGALPAGHAALRRDARGVAIVVRAAPVQREGRVVGTGMQRAAAGDGPLTVRVRYVIEAPVRGGRVRFALPSRGRDARAAVARLRVRSDELSGARVDGRDAVEDAVERSPAESAEVSASLTGAPAIAVEAWQARCGSAWCARLRAVAAPRSGPPRDVIVLLDASPSTHGSARGRIAPAVAAVLSTLPTGSRVAVAVFAARAEAVIGSFVPPTEVSLVEVARALDRELGSATRFEAGWELVAPWVGRARSPVVLVVGDGGLTTGEGARRALERARAAGVMLASLDVADRPSTPRLREAFESVGGLVLDAGPEAERAAAGHGMDALEERLSVALAPMAAPRVEVRLGSRVVQLGALAAGEQRVWEGVVSGRGAISLRAGSSTSRAAAPVAGLELVLRDRAERAAGTRERPLSLAAVESVGTAGTCGEARLESVDAPVASDVHLVLAEARACDTQSAQATVATGPPSGRIARLVQSERQSQLPPQSLLEMLRQRIVPVARGCFREDRAGRPSYQTRAVFHLRLSDREVVEARVEGRISAELSSCLQRAVDTLEIPRFDGTVAVRYPIYTAPELPPPTLALEPHVADAVDAILAP